MPNQEEINQILKNYEKELDKTNEEIIDLFNTMHNLLDEEVLQKIDSLNQKVDSILEKIQEVFKNI